MSDVLLCCPLPGPPPEYSGDCGSCKTHTWSTPGLGELYFFIPYENGQLFGFEFIPQTNNGSSIVAELYYCSNGICQVYETWNLGTLTSPVKKYTVIDFGNNPIYNTVELRITTTNGTSGSFNVCLDCDVPVVFMNFCTGFTYNQQLEVCECTGNTVYLFAEQIDILPGEFPLGLSGYGWYLDAELQIPAPCGDYMINENVIYRYNCNNFRSIPISFCDDCVLVPCTAETKSVLYTHTSFTKSNPYLRGTKDKKINGTYFFSEQCVNLYITPEETLLGYVRLRISYTGSPDIVYVTVSDPVAPDGDAGIISYASQEPPVSMFIPVDTQTLLNINKILKFKTIFVTVPPSRAIKIRVLAGYKFNNLSRPSVNSEVRWYDCGTPITGYTVGLHTYSAWDSIVTPRLKTTLYAYGQGNPNTWTVGTTVYSDRTLTQPAFPYFYGYSGNGSNQVVVKVGDYYRREWGRKRYYRSSQLKFKYKFEQVIEDYKVHDRVDENQEYRVSNCIDPVMDIGKITSITPLNQLLEPEVYYYLVGRHETSEAASNDDYFFRTDFTDFFSKKTGKKVPITGMEHALWKNSEALAAGVNKYILGFDDQAAGEIIKKRGRLVSFLITFYSLNITIGLAVILAFVNPGALVRTLAAFALGKIIENNPKFAKLLAAGNALGNIAKLLGKAIKKNGQSLLSSERIKGKGPLQWIWHQLFHRGKDKAGTDLCYYGNCSNRPKDEYVGRGLGWDLGFQAALFGLDRLYSSGYTRTHREQCGEFYARYTTGPYIFPSNTMYKLSGLTGVELAYYCDGAYMYKHGAVGPVLTVTNKKTAYKSLVTKRFLAPDKVVRVETVLPDRPLFVRDFHKLVFLPYTSGRPCKYFGEEASNIYKGANFKGDTYSNTQKSTTYTPPEYMTGELNNALPITMTVPADYFYSNVSQQDADDQAVYFLSGYTAATLNLNSSAESKPGVTDDEFHFSHRLEINQYTNSEYLNYLDTTNSGVQVGTKLFYDYDGLYSCLTGYYSNVIPGSGYYKKFYQVGSGGTVEDIWVMTNENDTTVTSQQTSQTVSLETQFSAYTSAWLFTGDEVNDTLYGKFYDVHEFSSKWATQEFYDSEYLCRGFMDNEGENIFLIYNSNQDITQGYLPAEKKFYRQINSYNVFSYVTDLVIYINADEVCDTTGTTSGTTGIMFTLKDISGNSVSSVYGVTFNVEVSYNGVANTTHEITFDEDDFEYFLILDPLYQGNISGFTITEYLSPNPYNTIYFTGGTFTSCGDCIIDGDAEIPEGTFTLDSQYGLQVDTMNVSYGQIPNFSYPFTGVTATTMVSSYIVGTDFEVILTGTRTAGTNKRIVLYVNNVAQSCEVISSDPSYTAYYLQTPIYINITDDINITIEDFTSC